MMREIPKILIVDDRLENLIALEKVLDVFDVEFIRTTSGNEALVMTLMYDFALAIVDIQMPEMDGYETVELMRQEEKTKLLPVIFVSAIYTEDFHIVRGIETGAVDFIPKPIVPVILRGKVKVFLDLYIHKTQLEDIVEKRTLELNKINKTLKQEIAERKKAYQIAEEAKAKALTADKHKSAFLASMSHEIRTPLNGIIAMSELILFGELNEEQRSHVNSVKKSGESLLDIINEILDLSKIEAGKVELEIVDFSIKEIINNIKQPLSIRIQKKNLKFSINMSPNIPEFLLGDPVKIRQVIINLIGNAIKFTERGKIELSIEVEQLTDKNVTVRFSVTDTGIGIPQDKIEGLFKSFAQADSSTTRKYGGTGLGLAISKQYIGLMGGKIDVESKIGQGSTFSFAIPLQVSTKKTEKISIKQSPERNIKNIKATSVENENISILVVEDQPINLEIIVGLLELKDYSITTACNGVEAVDKATNNKFDLIFMDIQMPEMDGEEATKKIREHEKDKNIHTPIVAMTAHAMKGHKDHFLEIGMDDYIEKPIKAVIVYDMVNKFNGNTI